MANQRFEDNIYSNPRQTEAEVIYSLVAPEAKEIGVVTLPAGNPFSRPDQIINEVTNISARIATFEPEHWRMDGSFVLPRAPTASNMEVGWWGALTSDASGVLTPAPEIVVTFPVAQSMARFGIAFDEPGGNYCTDFEVIAYGSSGEVLLSERLRDNASVYASTENGAQNAVKVVYRLYRTDKPFRYPRVSELDFGIVIKFTRKDITNLNLVTEANPAGTSFPVPQLNLTINNMGRFDQLDPNSYAQYLFARQAFQYRHGVATPDTSLEWAYMGVYYLQSWSVSDDKVSFTAAGKTALLENSTFEGSTLQTYTVGALIRRVLDAAGTEYHLDPVLDNSPSVSGWFGKKNFRALLANLAELSCCLCYENRQNTIEFVDIIQQLEPLTEINYTNMLAKPSVKQEPYYNGINLTEYTVTQESPEVQFSSAVTFYPAPWRDPLEPDFPYAVNLPCMVTGAGFPAFREWFLERKFALLRKRLSCEINWRQNPGLSVGDAASVQLNGAGRSIDMAVVKQTVNFGTSGLSGITKTAGDNVI